MSDDVKPRLIFDEVYAIIEDAIEKISRIVPSLSVDSFQSLESADRQQAAALIYTYIITKYFPERTAKTAENALSNAVDMMEATVRGEIEPELLRAAHQRAADALGVMSDNRALDHRATLLMYKEYRKRGVTKAEFVRRLIKFNILTVPKAQRKGICGTNFNNVYRELGRLLRKGAD
jgi:hypothetical protein